MLDSAMRGMLKVSEAKVENTDAELEKAESVSEKASELYIEETMPVGVENGTSELRDRLVEANKLCSTLVTVKSPEEKLGEEVSLGIAEDKYVVVA